MEMETLMNAVRARAASLGKLGKTPELRGEMPSGGDRLALIVPRAGRHSLVLPVCLVVIGNNSPWTWFSV